MCVRRGLTLGQVEREVTVSRGGSVRDLSGMWVVVWLEKNSFCSCVLFSENEGPPDLEKRRVRAKYRHLWV